MKNNFFVAIAFFLTCINFGFCQQSSANRDIRNHPDYIKFLKYGKNSAASQVAVKPSLYLGLESSIAKFFFYEQIPSDFPQAPEGISKEEYTTLINQWFSSHPERIRPEMKNKKLNSNGEIYENNK
jgi:hypothetical protein